MTPNTCRDWDSLISRRIDHELSGEEEALLSSHVSECGRCRGRLRAEQSASATLRQSLAPDDASLFDLESRIVSSTALLIEEAECGDKAGRGEKGRRARDRIPAVVSAAAASFAVGVALWVLFPLNDTSTSNESTPDPVVVEAPARSLSRPASVVQVRQDTHRIDPILLGDADSADPGRARIGLEVQGRRDIIRGPASLFRNTSPASAAAPTTATPEPRWTIEIETVDTRLVRFAGQRPWH